MALVVGTVVPLLINGEHGGGLIGVLGRLVVQRGAADADVLARGGAGLRPVNDEAVNVPVGGMERCQTCREL